MQPSESIRSNVVEVADRSAASSEEASATASVVTTTSIVARAGASMPAPLAMPPTDQPSRSTSTCLLTVSVVRMASAASVPPSADRAAAAPVTPAVSRSIGSSSPISPVEQTATSPAETPSACATCSAVAWVSRKPWAPVQALAPPELRTTASTRPSTSTWRLHVTGAASTRLPVKTAAAWWSGPSLTTRATSGRPLGLSPAVTPAARNPAGAVTLTAPPPRSAARWSRAGRGRGWRTGWRRRRSPW